ncbi:MAG TPA: bifunctional 3-deoxy-7-phosphoheptulonate synthase/chorismate mutase type II [Saprospiraceae bacterium]|nr:bifunctional 3-deoxy-7-phosphoheptulonate synthase/chorismate mutase type II [Saprospiraceae bacterium]
MDETTTSEQLTALFQKDADSPYLIAGPCSAETEEQLIHTARQLQNSGIRLFRSGVWKPRTRPGTFEGNGTSAFAWLKRVKKETGLPVAIEIANPIHIGHALNHDIDVLWIGARTTVNPFMVQDIADALKGIDIPVLVKNPVNPDLDLWIGGIERIQKAGVTQIAAVHRGFSSYAKTKFRNPPYWEIPVELRRRMPDIPLICDHSHICGNRESLLSVAQYALDLNYDGIMTEVHHDPDNAWSDAQQQITPESYKQMISSLRLRKEYSDDEKFVETLDMLRHKIDEIDQELIDLLARRMDISERIGDVKRKNNIAILQVARWNEIIRNALAHGSEIGLSEEFIMKYLSAIHQESIDRQSQE